MSKVTKADLYEDIQMLSRELEEIGYSGSQQQSLLNLMSDIKSEYFTLVVVGEFKNGKSTFLNALLEDDLLPVDVTPTTAAVHMLTYGEGRDVEVVKADWDREQIPATKSALQQFTAQADFNPHTVNYIKVQHPAHMLRDRLILVDTPGVNDLNEHRAAVTHQFVPRADGIIFMLDVQAPMRQTEQEFLQDYVLRNGTKHILFVANFIDMVDDEEEVAQSIDFINRRLSQLTGETEHNILPLSAAEAVEAFEDADEELASLSGMNDVKSAIHELVEHGQKQQEKLNRYASRLTQIKADLDRELEIEKGLIQESVESLEQEKARLDEWLLQDDAWEMTLSDYIQDRKREITFMTMKSIDHFESRLRRELTDAIEHHTGDKVDAFVDREITRRIKQELTRWVDQYSDKIHHLFAKLEQEIAKTFEEKFAQSSHVNVLKSNMAYESVTNVKGPKSSNTSLKSGAVIGGASTVAMALGTGVLFPIVAFVGYPWLNEKMRDKQWEKLKPIVHEQTSEHVDQVFNDFKQYMYTFIESTSQQVESSAIDEFKRMLNHYHETIEKRIHDKQKEEQSHIDQINTLTAFQNDYLKQDETEVVS